MGVGKFNSTRLRALPGSFILLIISILSTKLVSYNFLNFLLSSFLGGCDIINPRKRPQSESVASGARHAATLSCDAAALCADGDVGRR